MVIKSKRYFSILRTLQCQKTTNFKIPICRHIFISKKYGRVINESVLTIITCYIMTKFYGKK